MAAKWLPQLQISHPHILMNKTGKKGERGGEGGSFPYRRKSSPEGPQQSPPSFSLPGNGSHGYPSLQWRLPRHVFNKGQRCSHNCLHNRDPSSGCTHGYQAKSGLCLQRVKRECLPGGGTDKGSDSSRVRHRLVKKAPRLEPPSPLP